LLLVTRDAAAFPGNFFGKIFTDRKRASWLRSPNCRAVPRNMRFSKAQTFAIGGKSATAGPELALGAPGVTIPGDRHHVRRVCAQAMVAFLLPSWSSEHVADGVNASIHTSPKHRRSKFNDLSMTLR